MVVAMTANLTVGRKRFAAIEEQAKAIATTADELRGQLQTLVMEDARAYGQVSAAYRLPRETE